MEKLSITYPESLEETIQLLIEEGVYESRSEFFRDSAAVNLLLIDAGVSATHGVLEEADELKEAQLSMDKLRRERLTERALDLMEES